MRKVFLLLLALAIAGNANAASKVGTMGVPNSSGNAPLEVNSDRTLTIATDAGIILPYELATTNDTITAAETGKTFLVNPSSQATFTLPDADVGMSFTFTANGGHGDGTKKFILDPQSTDTIRGVVNSGATSTFAAGDSVISPGVTGDSITIFSAEDTYWDVVDMRGTFADNN